MPHFWWSYHFRQGNGNFGCEKTRDSGVTTGFSKYAEYEWSTNTNSLDTWSKFAVKKVDHNSAKFKWYHTNIFTRWLPSTNQTVILAFDLDSPVKERFLRAVMKPNESWLSDPFWIYPYLIELIALFEERYKDEKLITIQKDVVQLRDVEGKHGWTVGGFQMSVEGDRVVITVCVD